MRRRLILITLIVLPIAVKAQWALDSIPYKNTVKINPIAWFHPSVFYERTITTHTAAEVAIGGYFHTQSKAHTAGVLCANLSYRGYLANWWQHFQPFLQAGICFAGAYGTYDIFTGNDGWNINTRKYHLSEQIAAPFVGWGFRMTTGTHIMVEVSGQIALSKRWHGKEVNGIIDDIKSIAIATQMVCLKLGWAF